VRGESISELIDKKLMNEEPVFGITAEDLLQEYFVTTNPESAEQRLTSNLIITLLGLENKGIYKNAVFGLPALCVLGKGGMDLDCYVNAYWPEYARYGVPDFQGKKVVIPQRYQRLIQFYVELDMADVIIRDGKVDVTAAQGEADYAIDIVVTGKTCKEQKLGIFPPVLFLSDGVLLGNCGAKRLINKTNRRNNYDILSIAKRNA